MAYRPYFKHGIEQIQALVSTSQRDLKTLKVIQFELSFRKKPKALALKAEVDDLVRQLSVEAAVSLVRHTHLPSQPSTATELEPQILQHPPVVSDRVVIECANCKTPNFVSTLEGVTQHLSCSVCQMPYEAQFKYGVMRSTFQTKPNVKSGSSTMMWVIVGMVVLLVIVLMTK